MFRKYGLGGSIRMLFYLLRTRLYYPGARLIRFPFDLRNHRYIDLGRGLTTGRACRIEALPAARPHKPCIQFGRNVQLNDYVHIGAVKEIIIGDDVLIASKVFITDHNHGSFEGEQLPEHLLRAPISRPLEAKAVYIGSRCWLGENVVVLPGVSLGEGCVVGASAVVTKSFPAYSLIIGNPGRLYKRFNFESQRWEVVQH